MADLPWEDNLLEWKLESDLGDLLKTFSNTQLISLSNPLRFDGSMVFL